MRKKIELYQVLMFTIFLNFLGFIFNVSAGSKINFSMLGIGLRSVSFIILAIVAFFFYKLSKREIVVLSLVLFMAVLNRNNSSIYIIQILLTCFCLKRYDLKKIMKSFERISLIGISIIFINYFFKLTERLDYYGTYAKKLINRNTFGLVTPNIFYGIILCFLFTFVLYRKRYLTALLLSTFFYRMSISRNGYIVFVMYVLFNVAIKYIDKKIIGSLIKVIFFLNTSLFLFLIFAKKYLERSPFGTYLNQKLSGRLGAFEEYVSSLDLLNLFLGNNKNYRGPLDNSYLALLNIGGIISVIILYIVVSYKINQLIKAKEYYLSSYLIFLGIYYNFEAFMLNSGYILNTMFFLIILKNLKEKNGVRRSYSKHNSSSIQGGKIYTEVPKVNS